MAEIVACPSCQRQLQVPENFIGQTVQCPECKHMFLANAPSSAVQSTPASPSTSKQLSPPRPKERTTGPTDGDDDRPRRRRSDDFDDERDDFSARRRPHLLPHRATLIFILGILSICCVGAPVTGIIAWILGNIDVKAMDQGIMDPTGMSQTQTGKTLGMISTILFILGAAGYCFLVFFFVMAGHPPRRF